MALLSTVTFTSCSSDDDEAPAPDAPKEKRLASMTVPDLIYNLIKVNFEYDDQGRLFASHITDVDPSDNRDADDDGIPESFDEHNISYVWSADKVEIIRPWRKEEGRKETLVLANGRAASYELAMNWNTSVKFNFTYADNSIARSLWTFAASEETFIDYAWSADGYIQKITTEGLGYTTLSESIGHCKGYNPFIFTLLQNIDVPVGYLLSASPELFGAKMNGMPTKIQGANNEDTFRYTQDADGYITSATELLSDGSGATFTYEWE